MITIYDRLDGLDTTDLKYDTVQNGIKRAIYEQPKPLSGTRYRREQRQVKIGMDVMRHIVGRG